MLPTAAARTTRRSSFSEILGAGISPPPSLGVSRESLREPSRCPPRLHNFDPVKLQLICARDAYNRSEKPYVERGNTSSQTCWYTRACLSLNLSHTAPFNRGAKQTQAHPHDWLTYSGTDFWPEE